MSEPSNNAPESQPIAFISDIHGNLEALDAVLAELERRGVERIYVAGDLLLGGDAPLEVWRRLAAVGARSVRGLSDTALSRVDPDSLEPRTDGERASAERFLHARRAIGDLVVEELRRLPEHLRIPLIDGREVFLVHGSPADPTVEISHDLSDETVLGLLNDEVADIIVCGATHVPFQAQIDEYTVVNVGSVGAAPEGKNAHFTILTPKLGATEVLQDYVSYGDEES